MRKALGMDRPLVLAVKITSFSSQSFRQQALQRKWQGDGEKKIFLVKLVAAMLE